MLSTSKLFRNPSAGGATDPYFKYVPLLLETTTTNGQQNNTFLDSSTNNFTITRSGTPTQGSVTPYWPDGYWSNYFGGSADFANGTSASLAFGTSNFTLEAWVNVGSTAAANGVVSTLPSTGGPGVGIVVLTGGTVTASIGNSGTASNYTSASALTVGTWNHVAFVRSGSTVTLYINGTSVASGTNASSIVTTDFIVGRGYTNLAAAYFNGYISNARITNTAVYTGAFTPSTTPLTAVSGTILLTSQSNRFRDNSASPLTVTPGGTPKVQAFQPFSPPASYTAAAYGGSEYFNGSSDYLTAPANTAFAFGTGDFTVEAWIYTTSRIGSGNFGSQIAGCQIYGVSADWLFCLTAGGLLYFQITSSITGAYVSTSTVPLNAWTHVAFVRASGVVKAFINGVDAGNSGTYATSITNASTSFSVGGASNGSANSLLQGYISNLRIVKGTAVYSANFTPPTAPVTAITNTSLLLNYTNAGIYDAAVQNNAITVGDAQASTTVSKWSPTSMKFDGTGDWLTAIDGPQLQLGTGDFTIDGWLYLSANGMVYGIISKGTATTGWSVNVTALNKLQFSYTASNLTGTTSLAASTWYYFAVVRSGSATGNLKVYLNGSVEATSGGAVTDNFNQTNILYVGADRIGATPLNGYLQDVRITKAARTITTPTAAFPTR